MQKEHVASSCGGSEPSRAAGGGRRARVARRMTLPKVPIFAMRPGGKASSPVSSLVQNSTGSPSPSRRIPNRKCFPSLAAVLVIVPAETSRRHSVNHAVAEGGPRMCVGVSDDMELMESKSMKIATFARAAS